MTKKQYRRMLLSRTNRIKHLIWECHICAKMHIDRKLEQRCEELSKALENMREHITTGELWPPPPPEVPSGKWLELGVAHSPGT
jgi:hypothetical protein